LFLLDFLPLREEDCTLHTCQGIPLVRTPLEEEDIPTPWAHQEF